MRFSIILLIALAGCVPESKQYYVKPDQGEQQYKRDAYQCELDAKGLERSTGCEQMLMYEQCMESKGYQAVKGSGKRMLCDY